MRQVLREAVRDGALRSSDDPFLTYEMPKRKAVHRRKLSLEEVRALEAASLPPGSVTELARDVFVFSFYAGGMRFSDVCTLHRDEVRDGRAQYRMMKTGSVVSVPVPPPALAILEKYEKQGDGPLAFPLIEAEALSDEIRVRRRVNSRNVAINAALKRAAKVAEVNPDGLAKARQEKPDLILMDVVMPGMNGFQATRRLTRDPETSAIPVIMITAKDQETDRIWGMRQGARDYVIKPIKEDELVDKINALLEG